MASTLPGASNPPNTELFQLGSEPLVSDSIDLLGFESASRLTDHFGFMKELGLDYGWGPTALVEWTLEHIHVLLGTPWWGSIVLTAMLSRLVLFKVFIDASDNTARTQTLAPALKDLRARLNDAKAKQDIPAMMGIQREVKAIYKLAGVQMYKTALPLLQVPLGFGLFRLMRGMAALPVPGLENGGFLWITDLTVSDPYFILPTVAGISSFVLFRMSSQQTAGTNTLLGPTATMVAQYAFPGFLFFVMTWWPACLALTFTCTTTIATIQQFLIRAPWFRNWAKLQPFVDPGKQKSADQPLYKGVINTTARPSTMPEFDSETAPKGVIGGAISEIKGAYSQTKKQAKTMVAQTAEKRAKIELEEAKRYDERRRKEIKQQRFEAEAEKRYQREERRRQTKLED
ncbi:MAG: hypothetical protein LQ351_004279 [Letrouitia transgressa]|nr:MAG: hypothetical protein LQ351_004279 [Letrouitia transgressa]